LLKENRKSGNLQVPPERAYGADAGTVTRFCRAHNLEIVKCRRVNQENSTAPEPAGLRPRLTTLREALLALHKVLLESERA